MQVVKLNNGIELPTIGLGTNTFGKVDNNWNGEINFNTKEIETALKAGYTFLDTAIVYRNEAVLGLGYKKAGILRHHLYLQTKLPSSGLYVKDENAIREAIGESLHKLTTSYLDVVLIHQPRPIDEENLKIYQVLEKLVDEGRINTIGVSNFSIAQLDYLLKHARIKPAINQIEIHPGYWNEELTSFCQQNGVLVQAWSPLFRTSEIDKVVLTSIGDKYGKSWAQVVIRYLIEKGVMVISKSHKEQRQIENINVFDFSLSTEDTAIITGLNKANFTKIAILGGTGFVGRALTSEALRLGYQVSSVSLDAKATPRNHLTIIKENVKAKDFLVEALKDVKVIFACLNDKNGKKYLSAHLEALEIARALNKPLIVIGTFSNLFDQTLNAPAIEHLDDGQKEEEQGRFALLEHLKNNHDVNWTYISPSINVNRHFLHHPYNVGTTTLLKDQDGESNISVVDLVDFALEVGENQIEHNHQQITLCNK